MRLLSSAKLKELQQNPNNVRNICIMAHVDHGKTTLADSLVASNGIISQRLAGKLRYMDSRKDEQERGITMKSSSIALYYSKGNGEYLINLIDSPGHVDFSSEVSTAVRLCDGAIILVDVVEGVCPQTIVALKQAWLEKIKPVLVLNKIDRLILELKLTPLDSYVHLSQILEQVNAVVGELFTTEVLESQDTKSANETSESNVYNWSDGLDQADDSNVYFSPAQGNVVFASAIDGWAFSVEYFAQLYSKKLKLDEVKLQECLWGDFYLNSKTMEIMPGAQVKAKKPIFVQLVLDNIWTLYDTICVRKDKEKLGKIIDSLGIKITTRDLRHTDTKVQLQAVCSQWLPVALSVLDMVTKILPSPNSLSLEKVEKLMCSGGHDLNSYPNETQELKKDFLACSSNNDAPVIVFISKMFPIERKLLPQNRPKALTAEELAERREQARLKHAEKAAEGGQHPEVSPTEGTSPAPIAPPEDNQTEPELPEDVFIAFARVYSGRLAPGQVLYVLGPKHNPATALQMVADGVEINESLTLKDLSSSQHITKVKISDLYVMMGRELESIEEAHAGSVIGIGGLEEHVLKSATLSSVIHCPSFSELLWMAVPILRVAVEPKRPADLPALRKGLRLLNQADACVQVILQETGEHVLVTAGEVHLERCLDDLKTRYAKIDINVSEPIVPFRETVIPPPKVDMVNEVIQDQNTVMKKDKEDSNADGIVTAFTSNKLCTIKIQCVPLPPEVTELLEKNSELIKTLGRYTLGTLSNIPSDNIESLENLTISGDSESDNSTSAVSSMAEKTLKAVENFKIELSNAFKNAGGVWDEKSVNQIWCFGPRHCGPNLLINKIKGYGERNIWSKPSRSDINSHLLDYDSSFINGFQLATLAGPLCEEPMMGVAFVIIEWNIDSSVISSGGQFGQIVSAVKDGCRKSFQAQPQRLMAAMYSCNILANGEVLGKLYAVLGRRHGRVLHGDMAQGSANFNITAILPVVESFNFAQEIRKQTSGLASPQLVFSHWEVMDVDPFWAPSTEEEYLHFGEKADSENRARLYMDAVRRRKGLPVQQKIVQFAEKQRTLHKKK